MKIPSINRVMVAGMDTAQRFPATVISALVAALAGMLQVAVWENSEPETYWLRVMAAASLGLPLFTGITLLSERHGKSRLLVWLGHAVGLGILLLFYMRWPDWSESTLALRYFHLSATIHFGVAVVAYLGVREHNGFWQFNRKLFSRFLLAGVHSGVLFAGLTMALAGIDNLLGIDVDDVAYTRVFFFLAFVFQTCFFLAGVPDNYRRLEANEDYPSGLRVFAQYVLLPLVSIYLVILTAYLVRVLVTTTWPSGWIGYLVSALAALGILSLLLTHPDRESGQHRWIDRYVRTFWIAILPSIAMLLMAVWQRITQYGITEPRYLLTALAIWLAGIALYYGLSHSRQIKVIPSSLAALGLIAYLGPWSAYSVAERSQVNRLEGLLESYGVLAAGTLSPSPTEIPEEDWRQINNILSYLIERHGTSTIDAWFEGGVAQINTISPDTEPLTSGEASRRAALILKHTGLAPDDGLPFGPDGHITIAAERPLGVISNSESHQTLSVSGFEHLIVNADLVEGSYALGEDQVDFVLAEDEVIIIRLNDNELLRTSLASLRRRGTRGGNTPYPGSIRFPQDSLLIDAQGDTATIRIYVKSLDLKRENQRVTVTKASGNVLLSWKPSDNP